MLLRSIATLFSVLLLFSLSSSPAQAEPDTVAGPTYKTESARDIVVGQDLSLAELDQLDGSAAASTVSPKRWLPTQIAQSYKIRQASRY